jgi:hypothetical protein
MPNPYLSAAKDLETAGAESYPIHSQLFINLTLACCGEAKLGTAVYHMEDKASSARRHAHSGASARAAARDGNRWGAIVRFQPACAECRLRVHDPLHGMGLCCYA